MRNKNKQYLQLALFLLKFFLPTLLFRDYANLKVLWQKRFLNHCEAALGTFNNSLKEKGRVNAKTAEVYLSFRWVGWVLHVISCSCANSVFWNCLENGGSRTDGTEDQNEDWKHSSEEESTDEQNPSSIRSSSVALCVVNGGTAFHLPSKFSIWFAPSLTTHGSVSLMKWTKEMILPQAWDGVTCCKKAADGGHLELLRWLKNEGDDGWNSARISAQRGDEEMLRCGCWRKVI